MCLFPAQISNLASVQDMGITVRVEKKNPCQWKELPVVLSTPRTFWAVSIQGWEEICGFWKGKILVAPELLTPSLSQYKPFTPCWERGNFHFSAVKGSASTPCWSTGGEEWLKMVNIHEIVNFSGNRESTEWAGGLGWEPQGRETQTRNCPKLSVPSPGAFLSSQVGGSCISQI